MEDTLRGDMKKLKMRYDVLILVLMEDTLRDYQVNNFTRKAMGLNPCFNGRYSQSSQANG